MQRKTGRPIVCRVRRETIAEIDKLAPQTRETIFGGFVNRQHLCRLFARIVAVAGLSGSLKTIRKSAATAVENERAGAATELLGHSSSALARRHYIDPRWIDRLPPMPPRIA